MPRSYEELTAAQGEPHGGEGPQNAASTTHEPERQMSNALPELSDHQITQAMKDYGGGFVKQLGQLYRLADDLNKAKIKECWSEYWQTYSEMAERLRCPNCGNSNILRRCHDSGTVMGMRRTITPECDFKECENCEHQWDHNQL